MKAMILAAGQGTRLKPLTDHIPKPLVRFNGVPLLEIIINRLFGSGIDGIVINIHHMADQVLKFLKKKDYYNGRVVISDERDRLMDTGGGVLKARDLLYSDEPFLLHNVDVLTNLDINQLIMSHKKEKALITIAVKKRPTSRLLLFDEKNCLAGWCHNETGEMRIVREYKGKLSSYGNSCVYVFNPEFFDLVDNQEPVSLTDIYLELARQHTIKAFIHNDDYWYNLGLYESFVNAESVMKDLKFGASQL
jgi:MurNAc alpha-1-phosphate uridylyltransferase